MANRADNKKANRDLKEDCRRLLSRYRVRRRENCKFREENEDNRRGNEKMRRHPALHDNASIHPRAVNELATQS